MEDHSLKIFCPLSIKLVLLEVIKHSNIKSEFITDEITQQHEHKLNLELNLVLNLECNTNSLSLQIKRYRERNGHETESVSFTVSSFAATCT